MARYVILLRFTDQGVRAVKKSPQRAAAFRKAADRAKVKIESLLWTLGKCDGVLVLSATEERAILKVVEELAALGNVRTETLRAFDEKEMRAILR